MKKKQIWKILMMISLLPFLVPIFLAHTRMSSWTYLDWFLIWSYLYWPTYLLGFGLFVVSICKLRGIGIRSLANKKCILVLSLISIALLIGSFPLKLVADRVIVDVCRLIGFAIIILVAALRVVYGRSI